MQSQGRKKKSLINILIALLSNILIYILSLFTSKVIKENLGLQILGLNGVLSNVISILGLSEMGIGTAITFALYKPLAEKNESLIKSIMDFYKKAYRMVAVIVLLIGLILMPFIPKIIKHSDFSTSYILLVYSLFLFNSVVSYLLIYKRTLIVADQKNYVITTLTLIYTYVLKIGQLAVVYFTSNYILFLLVQIICSVIYNVLVSSTCNKLYPFIKGKADKLPDDLHKTIMSKIKAMFCHSLGSVVVYGTDNLLISYFCGITEAGKYTSYLSIISMITTFIVLFFDNIHDSIGNFLVTENIENKKILFNRLFFINQSLVSISSICLAILLTPFISMWLGSDTVLSVQIVIAMILSFYFSKNSLAIGNIKSAAGLFEQDKFIPIIESLINLISSIILAKFLGLLGIIIGTIISTVLCPFWVQPFIVYKNVFKENPIQYFKKYIFYTLRTVFIFLLSYFIINKVVRFVPNNFFTFLLEAAILFISVSLLWILTLFWKPEARYFSELIFSKLGKSK